jgi:hypothetical protein
MSVWNSFLGSNETEHSDMYEDQRRELIELWRSVERGGPDEYRQLEARIYRIGNQKNQRHICTEFCVNHPVWGTEKNLVGSIMDVFVNSFTKEYHICTGVDCGAEHVCSDGASTCTVSGLQFTEQRWINSFKLNHEYHRTSCSTVRVETALLKDIAKELIQKLLFSKERMKAEQKKLFDTRKEIQKQWVKEKRELERKGQRINAIHFITKSYYLRHKRIPKVYTMPSTETKKIIFEFYAQKICTMVTRLKTLTKFRGDTTSRPFICALLYIMRKGMTINDVAIVPKDFYLHSSLPECNQLDIFNVSKTHFTQNKTMILASMRDSILNGTNPHQLLVSSLRPT